MIKVGLWCPNPTSRSAPTRCFQWIAEALERKENIDVIVGSECDWEVTSVGCQSPQELTRRHGCDLVHWNKMLDRTIPSLLDTPTVLTYHGDVQWVEPSLNYGQYPRLRSLKERIIERAKIGMFDAVCFVSDDVHQRVSHRLPVGFSKTIWNGVPPHINPSATPAREDSYVFHVSQKSRRKNPSRLVDAWRRADIDQDLVIAGSDWDVSDNGVKTLGYVPDDELSSWYVGADAFLFPSLHECFGLPVIESIACGTIPVVSDRYALPEVANGDAEFCVPEDTESIAAALERAVERDITPTQRFTWESVADRTVEVYKSIL